MRLRGMQIDVRLDEIVLRALEVKPELRFQTAADFRTQLETIATDKRNETVPGATPIGPATADVWQSPKMGCGFSGLEPARPHPGSKRTHVAARGGVCVVIDLLVWGPLARLARAIQLADSSRDVASALRVDARTLSGGCGVDLDSPPHQESKHRPALRRRIVGRLRFCRSWDRPVRSPASPGDRRGGDGGVVRGGDSWVDGTARDSQQRARAEMESIHRLRRATGPLLPPALAAWQQGGRAAAISLFLAADWSAGPIFASESMLSLTESEYLSQIQPVPGFGVTQDMEARGEQMIKDLRGMKELVTAVAQAGREAADANKTAFARKHFSSLQQFGAALAHHQFLNILRLEGQAIMLRADSELRNLPAGPSLR